METTDSKSRQCSIEELKKRQELEHLLHLEKENAALKLENKQLQEEKQALLEENQRLNQIIEQLRDVERKLSSDNIQYDSLQEAGTVNSKADARLNYHPEIWRQVLSNLEQQEGHLTPLQHNLALLLAISVNNQRQSPMQEIQHEP